ncbi:MAG: Holliday junction resolvase RuvX [Bacteroidota bacterium]|nr:Holliday junction resolvase RuvX [Bacteroidota bacterium]
MNRIIGLDIGEKRIGLAISDALNIIATPVSTLAPNDIYLELQDLVTKYSVSILVIGYPINLDGNSTDGTIFADRFINNIKEQLPGIRICKVDERYTSKIAKKQLIESGIKRKKRQNKSLVDQMSAAIILQDYLNSQ